MNNKTIILASALFLLIIVGMFGYAYLARQSATSLPTTPPPLAPAAPAVLYPDITQIDAKHFFADGEHTLVGSLVMPTPCEVVTADATVAESFPEQVTIAINVVRTEDMCAQVLTEQRFQVSFSASEQASITAQFMGRDISLNLIPAAPGETPDSVEFFEKG